MTEQQRTPESYMEHLVYVALTILNEEEGSRTRGELMDTLESRGEVNTIPDELKERNPQNRIAWRDRFGPTAQMFVTAGYLLKRGRVQGWKLTLDGEEALASKDEEEFIACARAARNEKEKQRLEGKKEAGKGEGEEPEQLPSEDVDSGSPKRLAAEDCLGDAKDDIQEYVLSLDPRAFEELCAALLRGMGYTVTHQASAGADGGIDVVAYGDQLGGTRIKVQAKRYKANVAVDEVRNLAGSLKEGDVGVLITASRFTKDCEGEARKKCKHIVLIDFDRFYRLWGENYHKLSEKDKQRLPLQSIHFLAKE